MFFHKKPPKIKSLDRLAMSLYVAGLICEKEILINGFEWVNISFPTFEELFNKLI